MLVFYLLLPPIFGVLWFLNFIKLIEKMKDNKNYHNQKLLGAVLTFFLLLSIVLLAATIY